MKPALTILTLVFAFMLGRAQAQTFGAFQFQQSIDPITDADRSVLVTAGTQLRSNRVALLGWRCVAGGLTVSWMFGKYLSGADGLITVQHRFDKTRAAPPRQWVLTTNHEGVSVPAKRVAAFTRAAASANALAIQVTDSDGEQLTDSFSLDGLDEGLHMLPCYRPRR
jgi:hypothetical protein